jgi:predicted RNA-binding protein associated with RNAse of E/G family
MSERIVEVKRYLDGREGRFECEPVLVDPGRRAVLMYVADRVWRIGDIEVTPGCLTYAHFWTDRPYNVYHFLDGDRTLSHYANIGECLEISPSQVVWRDYAVDVLVTPDGAQLMLDEDELPDDLDPRVRGLVERTARWLTAQAPRVVSEVEAETRKLRRPSRS